MRYLIKFLGLYVILFIQILFTNKIYSYGVFPNLVIIYLINMLFFCDRNNVLHMAFWGGLSLDVFSVKYFGINTLLFVSLMYYGVKTRERFFIDNTLSEAILGIIIVLLYYLGYTIALSIPEIYKFFSNFLFIGIPAFLYTSFILIVINLMKYYFSHE